jgi:acetate kinase
LKVFTRSVRQAIGGFAWLMGGLDAVVYTGGIGEHDAATRAEVLAGVPGVSLDAALNEARGESGRAIQASQSTVDVFVMQAQEDLMIAHHMVRMMQ